ncbi:D-2-hydroxyacid dehydrogenase [Endozoicomonas arenosclerae]|uniref:D-2-hydroxyacid dehydrogenase n=1 Tax=Endozoicomonas arenosclerae TaxID=1633495 RepID=UPI000781A39C|nr:D-2-hydroxyacid dehydrogenase [Endozoicomonas arenosclerae]
MSTTKNAVLLDQGTLGAGVSLEAFHHLSVPLETYEQSGSEDVVDRCRDAVAIFTNKVVIDEAALSSLPNLRYIGVLATGTNNIDLAACDIHGIRVQNVERYSTASVAQHAMALILSLAGYLPAYSRDAANGTWAASDMFCLLDHPIIELEGKTLLIVGYGDLGKATARLAEAFGMKIMKARVPGSGSGAEDRIELDEGLKEADVVSLHCPLIESTCNLIDQRRLSLMKDSAILINTSRGGLVDEMALLTALESGQLGAAGFDVLTEEPPVNGNPLLQQKSLPNLIVTPHCAWGSLESRQRLVNLAAQHFEQFLEGV